LSPHSTFEGSKAKKNCPPTEPLLEPTNLREPLDPPRTPHSRGALNQASKHYLWLFFAHTSFALATPLVHILRGPATPLSSSFLAVSVCCQAGGHRRLLHWRCPCLNSHQQFLPRRHPYHSSSPATSSAHHVLARALLGHAPSPVASYPPAGTSRGQFLPTGGYLPWQAPSSLNHPIGSRHRPPL
jgi:hypothetical protein